MTQLLENKIIVSTRPYDRNSELLEHIEMKGGKLMSLPLIDILPAEISPSDKKMLSHPEVYQWLIFTSVNGVKYFLRYFDNIERDVKALLKNCKIAAIGDTTALYAKKKGLEVAIVSAKSDGENFALLLKAKVKPGERMLLVRGNLAGQIILNTLKAFNTVDVVTLYKTQKPQIYDHIILDRIRNNQYDIILMTSPSGVNNLKEVIGNYEAFANLRLAAIGTKTASAIEYYGGMPKLIFSKPYADVIASELEEYFRVTEKNNVL